MALGAHLSADFRQGLLTSLYLQSQAGKFQFPDLDPGQGITLISVLKQNLLNRMRELESGAVLNSTSGGGYSMANSDWDSGMDVTPMRMAAFANQLLAIYNSAITTLAGATMPVPNPTDTQIYNTMLADDRMQPVTSYQGDYTVLRWPARF